MIIAEVEVAACYILTGNEIDPTTYPIGGW
jgi:hypothetical protein